MSVVYAGVTVLKHPCEVGSIHIRVPSFIQSPFTKIHFFWTDFCIVPIILVRFKINLNCPINN